MISVIILTENCNYSVLEVPQNGRLVIMERHLICGIVENGVKVVPYGERNPLTAFETFLFENTMSVEMVPYHLYHPERRILDFTNMELLQAQFTIHPSNSGSTVDFVPPTFVEGGFDINYNLIVGGLNLTAETAQEMFRRRGKYSYAGATLDEDGVCNAVIDLGDGYQHLSTHFINSMGSYAWRYIPVTAIIDREGLFKEFTANPIFHSNPQLEILELAGLKDLFPMASTASYISGLKKVVFSNLESIGIDASVNNGAFNVYPLSVHIEVPRIFETMNSGNLHAALQWAKDNKAANIVFID